MFSFVMDIRIFLFVYFPRTLQQTLVLCIIICLLVIHEYFQVTTKTIEITN